MMETINDIVLKVAVEMINTSMQEITAEVINRWATRIGDAATCEKSSQVGNAAKCKELLGEVYVLLDKSKSYIIDVESIDRRREFSHYLTRAKNLVDNIISQELGANVRVGNAAKMREALEDISNLADAIYTHNECANENSLAILSMCDKALSTPPRNCDLYRTKKERNAAYEKYREYVIMSNSNPFIAQDEMMSKEEWLFAETKGEVK
jgi:hypothetical protein